MPQKLVLLTLRVPCACLAGESSHRAAERLAELRRRFVSCFPAQGASQPRQRVPLSWRTFPSVPPSPECVLPSPPSILRDWLPAEVSTYYREQKAWRSSGEFPTEDRAPCNLFQRHHFCPEFQH